MPLSGAILGAGALGLAGSGVQAFGATTAAGEQAKTAQQALSIQQQMFNTAQGALSPYYTAGQGALHTLSGLLSPGGSAAALQRLPGFQFQSKWGNMQAENALGAEGLGGSKGPLASAISQYNQGLAGTSFFNEVGALQNYASMGAGAAGALGGLANQSGQIQGNTLGSLGAAQAAGMLGTTNAISGGLGGLGNNLLLGGILGGGFGGSGGIYGGGSGSTFPEPLSSNSPYMSGIGQSA